jgi:hypothetical protein
MMASEVRKTLSELGTREPTRASTPSAKAMSVAVGTAQPRQFSGWGKLTAMKITAGTNMPPKAAINGSARRGQVSSSPSTNPLDPEPDQEKEKGHQPIVDLMPQIEASDARM